MHFSEDELRNALRDALRREDPGPAFTQQVMAAIAQAQTQEPTRLNRPGFFPSLSAFKLRPAFVGAMAVLILAGAGLGYLQHEQSERARTRMAEQARSEAILALRIANAKLNRVLQKVRESQQNALQDAQELRIRRERL